MSPATAAVVNAGGAPGGSFADRIPGGWRTVAIGGGIVLALIVVLIQRGKGGGGGTADTESDASLGPNAAAALGQIQYEQKQLAGEASVRDAALVGAVESLAGQIGTVQGNLNSGLADVRGLVDQRASELTAGLGGAIGSLDGRLSSTQSLIDQRAAELTAGFTQGLGAGVAFGQAGAAAPGQLLSVDVER